MIFEFMEYAHWIPTLFASFIFVQSLRHKFFQSGETKYIFEEKLNTWAGTLGFNGLFAPGGLFSAVHIGIFELIASFMMLIGAFSVNLYWLQGIGALLGLGIISGAIFFHLFTPLGVVVRQSDGAKDGGGLFITALFVWLSCAILVALRLPNLVFLIS